MITFFLIKGPSGGSSCVPHDPGGRLATVSPPSRHFLDVFVEVAKPYKTLYESTKSFGVLMPPL